MSIEATKITNAVRLGCKNEGSARSLTVKFGDIDHTKRWLKCATKVKYFHKHTGKDSRLYMVPDLTLTRMLENKRPQNEPKARKENGWRGLMVRGGEIIRTTNPSKVATSMSLGKEVELNSYFTHTSSNCFFYSQNTQITNSSSSLNAYHNNVDCISNKMDEFSCIMLRMHPDIIALTEDKPKNQGSPIQFSELIISGHDVRTNIEQV